MRKYAVGVVALAALAAYAGTPLAQSAPTARETARASSTTLTVAATTREVLLSNTCGGYPRIKRRLPCQTVFLGVQNLQGSRALIYAVDTFVRRPSRNTYTYRAVSETYDENGTFNAAYTGKFSIRKDGIVVDHGAGRYTKGTGVYHGMTGSLSYTGANRSDAKVWVYPGRATVTLP